MATRESRFATLRGFYVTVKGELMSLDAAKANVEAIGYVIYPKELKKFQEKFPEIDIEDFEAFLKEIDAWKEPGKKKGSGGARQTSLDTDEKAASVGVTPENFEKYKNLISQMQELKHQVQAIVPDGTVAISIPKKSSKKNEAATGNDENAPVELTENISQDTEPCDSPNTDEIPDMAASS